MPIKTIIIACLLFGAWKLYGHQLAADTGNRALYEQQLAALGSKKGVTLFTAAWCGYCDKLKERLSASAVPFTEYDVETSPQGKLYGEKSDFNGVPIIVVDGNTIKGYDLNAMPPAFKRAGYHVTGL